MAKVLIVDDSLTEMRRFTQFLTRAGHEVISANCGEDGVKMATEQQPDLILMDVVMPGINGFQATRLISKNQATSHIPIIMVTTKDQETDKVWGKRQGAAAYLTKPVPEDLLFRTMNELLG
jgi:twitching motility two-component system response regulator PilH